MKCRNNCIITGKIENLNNIDRDLNKNFSMQDLVPVNDPTNEDETAFAWGTATTMELQAYMFSDFEPEHIFYASLTDAPNELFWRNVSRIYNVEVNYSFYNKKERYIGSYKYKEGMLISYEYYENENTKEYIDLLNKNISNFLDLEEDDNIEEASNNVRIIAFEDLKKRGN